MKLVEFTTQEYDHTSFKNIDAESTNYFAFWTLECFHKNFVSIDNISSLY